jgi:hypothetical protein
MSPAADGVVKIVRNGKEYSATYRVLGGVVTVNPTVGPTEDLAIDIYDKPADEIAMMLLEKHIDAYLNKAASAKQK